MLDRSLADREGRERARVVVVKPNGQVLMSTDDDIGEKTPSGQTTRMKPLKVKVASNYENLPHKERLDRYVAGFVHSHGIDDVPMSPQDLKSLFEGADLFGTIPMIMVITPELKQVIFRGKDTPLWPTDEVNKKTEHWLSMLYESIRKRIIPGMTPEQQIGINAIVTHGLIRAISKKYDLRRFSCPVSSNIATIESA